MIEPIVLGLGGNVGGDDAIVARFAAVAEAFAGWGRVTRSRVYRTAPVGPAQPDFLNAAIAVRPEPAPTPDELIAFVLETERLLGRDRRVEARWGPRAIDVDVLLWGARVGRWVGEHVLEVPHPRVHERRFALAPLADVLGEDAVVPGAGRVGDLLARVRDQDVRDAGVGF